MNSPQFAALSLAWLGFAPGLAMAETPLAASDEHCACVTGTMDTDAEVRRCEPLLNAWSPAQMVDLKGRCAAKGAPADGPDRCFCLTGFHTDPRIIQACEAVVGRNTKPSALARMAAECR
ncbi:MAG: hypothetical protein KDH20_19725 [Rhodocyclaceae bacterium]|nr:hypothetical protein [Rhodocyclaceae bacterium]